MMHDQFPMFAVVKGVTGMLASFGGAFITLMSHIEITLRVLGVAVGIACGIASLISIVRNMPPKKRKNRLP